MSKKLKQDWIDEVQALKLENEALKVRVLDLEKESKMRCVSLRWRVIGGYHYWIEDPELEAMRVVYKHPRFAELELECDRCKGTGIYLHYGECWKCKHGRMVYRKGGILTIVDQGGEVARPIYNQAKEDRRMALEEQTPNTKAPVNELD
ncbi:MAG: hypothetical protein ACXQS4_05020, partial [Methermicoccaceae archaeon]